MACGSACVDIEIEDPIRNNPKYKCPEIFYSRRFVTTSKEKLLDTNMVSKVFHGTHFDEIEQICGNPGTAEFKGKVKQWRTLGYSSEYCSYIVMPEGEPKPVTDDTQCSFGPFLWFGINKDEAKNYGPYQFEFNFKSTLKAYLQSRGCDKELCYRVGGTLLYTKEISHIVIICCTDDKEYQSYPLLDATCTKYFRPPVKFIGSNKSTSPLDDCTSNHDSESIEPPKQKKQKLHVQGQEECVSDSPHCVTQHGTLVYKTLPPECISYPAMASTSVILERRRHENVALAFYIPQGTTLKFTNEVGKLSKVDHVKEYCVNSKGDCKYKDRSYDISKFNYPVLAYDDDDDDD